MHGGGVEGVGETAAGKIAAALKRCAACGLCAGEQRSLDLGVDVTVAVHAHDWPALLPRDGDEHGLTPQIVPERIAQRTDAKTYRPPVPVLILDQIGMSHGFDRQIGAAVGEDRIVGARFIRTIDRIAPRDRDHVAVFGAALRHHEIVHAVDLVEVGTLGVVAAGAVPRIDLFADMITADLYPAFNSRLGQCQLRDEDACVGAAVVDLSIVVKKERGIDPAKGQHDRV